MSSQITINTLFTFAGRLSHSTDSLIELRTSLSSSTTFVFTKHIYDLDDSPQPTPYIPFPTHQLNMRSSGILSLALTTLVGISMVSAASPHGKFDRRNHKAIIADRQAKEATVNGIPEAAINKRTGKVSRKYKKRGGKICRVKDAAAPSSLASSSSSAASSASSTAVSFRISSNTTANFFPTLTLSRVLPVLYSESERILGFVHRGCHPYRRRRRLATGLDHLGFDLLGCPLGRKLAQLPVVFLGLVV